jgi:hypothetical protein
MPYGSFIGMVAFGILYSISSTMSITEKKAWKKNVLTKNADQAQQFRANLVEGGVKQAEVLRGLNSLSLESIENINGLSSGAAASLGSLAAGLASSRSLAQFAMGLTGFGLSLALLSISAWYQTRVENKKLSSKDAEQMSRAFVKSQNQAEAEIKEIIEWLTDTSGKPKKESTQKFISLVKEKEITSYEIWNSASLSGVSLIMLAAGAAGIAVDMAQESNSERDGVQHFVTAMAGYLGISAGFKSAVDAAAKYPSLRRKIRDFNQDS